jgi:hypothetical protein
VAQADLDGHAAAHAVADDVGALDLQRVEHGDHGAGEEPRVVARAQRLGRVAEPGEVERDGPARGRQGGHGGQERGLRRAQAVQEDDRRARAGLHRRDRADLGRHRAEAQPAVARGAGRRRQEADAEVQVVAHL